MSAGEGKEGWVVLLVLGLGPEKIVEILRTRKPRLYSFSALAHLLGASETTAYRLALKGDSPNKYNKSVTHEYRRVDQVI